MNGGIPDYPPGPRGPEESDVPGPRLRLTPDQVRYIARCVDGDGASSVEIEERGSGYFQVRVFDRDNALIFERRVRANIGKFDDPHAH